MILGNVPHSTKHLALHLVYIIFEQVQKELKKIALPKLPGGAVLCGGGAKIPKIKEFAKKHKKPVLKGAFVEQSTYIGENMLDTLVSIKSKEELIGDVIGLLQSPMKNVISALQSGGTTIHGILETLGEKE